jgi:hypothetical protein
LARAAAAVLRLDCALILLLVCRVWFNAAFARIEWLRPHFSFDKVVVAHKLIGCTIALLVAMHVVGHVFNFRAWSAIAPPLAASFEPALADALLDPVSGAPPSFAQLLFTRVPGATGLALLACFALVLAGAVPYVRQRWYELFW